MTFPNLHPPRFNCSDLTDASGHTILVGANNPVNARLLRILWEKYGCVVKIAGNGGALLRLFAAEPECTELFMDMRKPV